MMEGFGLRKGAWTKEEDELLKLVMEKHGEGKWHLVPRKAGLKRCRKSCRLRWLNYLRPNIKRGEFTEDEVDLIIRLHKLLGNRWSLIAGRLPGRTANDVKNYWNTYQRKKNQTMPSTSKNMKADNSQAENTKATTVVRPRPRTFIKRSNYLERDANHNLEHIQSEKNSMTCLPPPAAPQIQELENEIDWWSFLSEENTCTDSIDRATCSSLIGLDEDFFKIFWVEDNMKQLSTIDMAMHDPSPLPYTLC